MSFFFQAEDGIRDLVRSRGLGDVYKRQGPLWSETIERPSEFEWLGFPRLVALAEVGWTPQELSLIHI